MTPLKSLKNRLEPLGFTVQELDYSHGKFIQIKHGKITIDWYQSKRNTVFAHAIGLLVQDKFFTADAVRVAKFAIDRVKEFQKAEPRQASNGKWVRQKKDPLANLKSKAKPLPAEPKPKPDALGPKLMTADRWARIQACADQTGWGMLFECVQAIRRLKAKQNLMEV